jgi:hypothetical protein
VIKAGPDAREGASGPVLDGAVLTRRCDPKTIAYMKDATLTIRLPAETRRRIEALAEAEHRSLSQQVERLVELGFATLATATNEPRVTYGARSVEGALEGAAVTTLDDWRAVRQELSRSLSSRMTRDKPVRR